MTRFVLPAKDCAHADCGIWAAQRRKIRCHLTTAANFKGQPSHQRPPDSYGRVDEIERMGIAFVRNRCHRRSAVLGKGLPCAHMGAGTAPGLTRRVHHAEDPAGRTVGRGSQLPRHAPERLQKRQRRALQRFITTCDETSCTFVGNGFEIKYDETVAHVRRHSSEAGRTALPEAGSRRWRRRCIIGWPGMGVNQRLTRKFGVASRAAIDVADGGA